MTPNDVFLHDIFLYLSGLILCSVYVDVLRSTGIRKCRPLERLRPVHLYQDDDSDGKNSKTNYLHSSSEIPSQEGQ